jgi:hypothetical protein
MARKKGHFLAASFFFGLKGHFHQPFPERPLQGRNAMGVVFGLALGQG